MMNEDERGNQIKFQSKFEIVECIKVLTPFTNAGNPALEAEAYPFALEKIKELTKLL